MQCTIRDLLIQTTIIAGWITAALLLKQTPLVKNMTLGLLLFTAMGGLSGAFLGGFFKHYRFGALIGAFTIGTVIISIALM